MASIEPYETKQGLRYRVRYRTPGRKQGAKRGFIRKKDAEKFAREIETAKDTGQFINPSSGKLTVGSFYEQWEQTQDLLAVRTKRSNLSAYKVHVKPHWENRQIGQITTPQVRQWVIDLQGQDVKRATILRAIHVLRGILNTAIEDRKLATNPVQNVKLQRDVDKRRPYLTAQQVELLAGAMATDNDKAIVYTLAYCGLRISELAAVTVEDYQPRRARLNVSKSVKGDGAIGPTKTYEKRQVPIPGFLGEKLTELSKAKGKKHPLFVSPEGHRIDVDNFRVRVFKPAVEALRIEHNDFPKITPHSLRHTCASFAISSGANVKAVQGLLGHESAAVTLNVYADLFPDDLDAVGVALDTFRSEQLVSK
ncbi:tyrosine-type recombinase/integrase [Corynebacterium sp. S7]